MQSDARDVATNGKGAFDDFVDEDTIPVVEAEQPFPYEPVTQRQMTHAPNLIAGTVPLNEALLDGGMIGWHAIEIAHNVPYPFDRSIDHIADVDGVWHGLILVVLYAESLERFRLAFDRFFSG